jgi:hypothetical protein
MRTKWLTFAMVGLMTLACSKEDQKTEQPNTPAVPTNNGTLVCKVNGVEFKPTSVTAARIPITGMVVITAKNGDQFIELRLRSNTEPGTYEVKELLSTVSGAFQRSAQSGDFKYSKGGTLNLLESNLTTKKLKGNFSFTTYPFPLDGNQEYQISDGDFDVTYVDAN